MNSSIGCRSVTSFKMPQNTIERLPYRSEVWHVICRASSEHGHSGFCCGPRVLNSTNCAGVFRLVVHKNKNWRMTITAVISYARSPLRLTRAFRALIDPQCPEHCRRSSVLNWNTPIDVRRLSKAHHSPNTHARNEAITRVSCTVRLPRWYITFLTNTSKRLKIRSPFTNCIYWIPFWVKR